MTPVQPSLTHIADTAAIATGAGAGFNFLLSEIPGIRPFCIRWPDQDKAFVAWPGGAGTGDRNQGANPIKP